MSASFPGMRFEAIVTTSTVEPLNNGHIRGRNLVLYWEVVTISEVYRLASNTPQSQGWIIEGVACGRSNQRFYAGHVQNRAKMEQFLGANG